MCVAPFEGRQHARVFAHGVPSAELSAAIEAVAGTAQPLSTTVFTAGDVAAHRRRYQKQVLPLSLILHALPRSRLGGGFGCAVRTGVDRRGRQEGQGHSRLHKVRAMAHLILKMPHSDKQI